MNNKIISSLGLAIAISTSSAIADTQDISNLLTSPPYIGVSFSMGEGVQFQVPEVWLTDPELPLETQEFIRKQALSKK